VKLKNSFNNLSKEILGEPYDENFRSPANYKGKLFGKEYLAEKGKRVPMQKKDRGLRSTEEAKA